MSSLEQFRAHHPGIRADFTIAQDWTRYTPEEHATWRRLYSRMEQILPGRACDEFRHGLAVLGIESGIPDLARLTETLRARTGWSLVTVPGLVPEAIFFEHLAHRRFPVGRFLRRPDQLDYLEEPDIFHDVFGHVPMLVQPVFADYLEAFGWGACRAQGFGALEFISRLYWYTVEFGLIRQPDGLRFYGSGIASSAAESVYCIEDPSPNRLQFELERVMRTRYRIDDFQESYFVIDSFEHVFQDTYQEFAPLYARLKTGLTHEPGAVLASDRVHHRGTGSYRRDSHRASAA
jgi:phenylalanine-4-hydroxylase